jgi:hypothetical protein
MSVMNSSGSQQLLHKARNPFLYCHASWSNIGDCRPCPSQEVGLIRLLQEEAIGANFPVAVHAVVQLRRAGRWHIGIPQKMKAPPRKRTACFVWKAQSQYWLEAVSNMKPYSWVGAAIEGGIVYGIWETNHAEVGWEFVDQWNSPGRRHFRTPSKSEHLEHADGDTQCNDRRIVVLQLQLVARISSKSCFPRDDDPIESSTLKISICSMKHLSMNQGSLLCHAEISQTIHGASFRRLGIFGRLWMSRGATTWFETVWSYCVEAIDYWTIFSMKLNKIETENCIGIWGRSWCCWQGLSESVLIEFISQFSELRLLII